MSYRVACPECGHEILVPEIVPRDPFDHPIGCGECDMVAYPIDAEASGADDVD